MGGYSNGLLFFPPTIPGKDKPDPYLIPWSELLDDGEDTDNHDDEVSLLRE